MDEARRFLRYILPGLVFPVMLLITLLISDSDRIICLLEKYSDKQIIGVIGGVFLASGTLGYIFSVIYWARYWLKPRSICKIKIIGDIAIDHKPLLRGLEEGGRIEVVNIFGNRVDLEGISKREAFVIFSQHWWTSRIENEADKDKFISIDRLADIMHAIGATIISILFSYFVWAISHSWYLISEPSISDVWVLLMVIALIFVFWKNYWDIHKSLRSLLNSLFANMVENQFEKRGRRVTIRYSE